MIAHDVASAITVGVGMGDAIGANELPPGWVRPPVPSGIVEKKFSHLEESPTSRGPGPREVPTMAALREAVAEPDGEATPNRCWGKCWGKTPESEIAQ